MATRSLFSRILGRVGQEAGIGAAAGQVADGANAEPAAADLADQDHDRLPGGNWVVDTAPPRQAWPDPAGMVEALDSHGASGWAFDPAYPGVAIEVAAFLGTSRLALATADATRADLAASLGHGSHGFQLAFAPPLADGEADRVMILALSHGLPVILRAPAVQDAEAAESEVQEPGQSEAGGSDAGHSDAGTEAPAAAAPLFILGSAPDAADLLTRTLIETAGFAGPARGQLMPLANHLTRALRQFYRGALPGAAPESLLRQIEAPVFRQAIRRMFVQIMAQRYPEGGWIDNTPGLAGINVALLLRAIWPKARFIFVSARLIESVNARVLAEPAVSWEDHAGHWLREMQAWAQIRSKLRQVSLVLDAHDLAGRPRASARAVADFLKLDKPAAAALVAAVAAMPRGETRPAATAAHQAQAIDQIKAAAGPTMALFGYGWGDAYYDRPAASADHPASQEDAA